MSESEDRIIGLLSELLIEQKRTSRELTTIRQLVTTAVQFARDAESEIPENYRRFVNAFHDVHHIKWVYEEVGIAVPPHIHRELERLDDRYRQMLEKMNTAGGAFDKVRREMADDPNNRWDHTRLLMQEKPNETRKRSDDAGSAKEGTDFSGSLGDSSEPDRIEHGEPRNGSGENPTRRI